MQSFRVEQCVELLCQKGCKALWADIALLEAGETVAEARSLTREERVLVLRELKSIMAVYTDSCCPQGDG